MSYDENRISDLIDGGINKMSIMDKTLHPVFQQILKPFTLRQKCSCVNVEIGSYDNQVELPRPPHMPSTRGVDTICVDACLKDEILNLWSLGITTTGCCCGHNKGDEYPFIGVHENDIPKMKAMGYKVQFNNCRPSDEDSFIPKSL